MAVQCYDCGGPRGHHEDRSDLACCGFAQCSPMVAIPPMPPVHPPLLLSGSQTDGFADARAGRHPGRSSIQAAARTRLTGQPCWLALVLTAHASIAPGIDAHLHSAHARLRKEQHEKSIPAHGRAWWN